jgi:hypothetical protein
MSDRKTKILKLENLNSLISFDDWIKKAISRYSKKNRISLIEKEKYLNYIMSKVGEEVGKNKSDWIIAINSLLERLEYERSK